MALSADMSHLAEELRTSYESRISAVVALQTAMGQQIAELHAQRQAIATAQHQQLQLSAEARRQAVATLLHDLQAERTAVSIDQHQQRDTYTRDLRQRTGDCLAHANAARQAIHNDHAAAQQAWKQFNDEMQRQRVGHGQRATPHQ